MTATASATAAAAAAKAAKAAKTPEPPAAPQARRGRKPRTDEHGNPVVSERKPAKPKAERLADAQAKLANFDKYVADERAKLEAKIAKLSASVAPKTIDKDTALAAAAGLGSTPSEIKATIAKRLAEAKQLQALSKALGGVSDEELAASLGGDPPADEEA